MDRFISWASIPIFPWIWMKWVLFPYSSFFWLLFNGTKKDVKNKGCICCWSLIFYVFIFYFSLHFLSHYLLHFILSFYFFLCLSSFILNLSKNWNDVYYFPFKCDQWVIILKFLKYVNSKFFFGRLYKNCFIRREVKSTF